MGTYKNISRLFLLVWMGLFAHSAYSLALAEEELKSQLNQQLDVRIQLLTDNVSELDELRINISQSHENFSTSRIELKYELIKSESGNYLKITSRDVIQEPVVEFTLDIGWSDGHVIRDYSFLIDPPKN